MRTYAVVGTDTSSTFKTTRIDTEGGSYPTWNHNLQLELGLSESILIHRKAWLTVTIHVYCKTLFGKKMVGWTKVPFSDMLEGYRDPHSNLHFLSYRLKTSKGKPQAGIINLCVRLLPKVQYNHFSEQPRFNSEPVQYSEQGNIQNSNYSSNHYLQPQNSRPHHPSEFHQAAGGSFMSNTNAASSFPRAAPLVYPPPPPYSSYAYSIK